MTAAADGAAATASVRTGDNPRTALVVVHGMGEQRPMETLNNFVRTALAPIDGERIYYCRPALQTDSYEARRYLAIARSHGDDVEQGQTEIFEYHWSYLMTGNKLADLLGTAVRLLLHPWRLPASMRGFWLLCIAILAAVVVAAVTAVDWSKVATGSGGGLRALLAAMGISGLTAGVVVLAVGAVSRMIAASFVDVVRYLDTSPRSYAARRAIRGGLVEFLRKLQDGTRTDRRYDRVVVIAHSLGAYIAYDAITSLWSQTHRTVTPPGDPAAAEAAMTSALATLEAAAKPVRSLTAPEARSGAVSEYQAAQRNAWAALRGQGSPWLITDFISVGTPMHFADVLVTRSRREFNDRARRGDLLTCPPASENDTVERDSKTLRYGVHYGRRTLLGAGSPFAVTRWTNLWFPTRWWLFGDWFGGRLQPLYGYGINDEEVLGNKPGRLIPALAHTRYFAYPDDDSARSVATAIRRALELNFQLPLRD